MDISTASCVRYEFKCLLCPMVFPNLRALRGHAKDHMKTSPPYNCNICPFICNEKVVLQRHIRTHKGDQPYKCGLCNDFFSTKSNCKRHLLKTHAITSEEQLLSLLTENEQTPEKKSTPPAAVQTAVKDQVLTPIMQNSSMLLALISKMAQADLSSGVPPIWNPELFLNQYRVASEADLARIEDAPMNPSGRRDEKIVTNSSAGEEDECNESITSEQDYEDSNGWAAFCVETIIHSTDEDESEEREEKEKRAKTSAYSRAPNRVTCPVCKVTFPWTSSLKRHILVHTGEKPFRCKFCPLSFTTKSNCLRHQKRKHSNQKNLKSSGEDSSFKCDFCFKKFYLKLKKDEHMELYCIPRARHNQSMES
ncbi:Hypothetical predicted protein [Cloeon dipterum]|nr:Hypothetical predicted protein [Cloeon dipterum]